MSTKPFVNLPNPPGGEFDYVMRRQWQLAGADDGDPVALPRHADRSIQVAGVYDGATLAIEGTIDGIEWGLLTDPQGNDLSFTAHPSGRTTKIEAVSEAVLSVRPKTTGGGGATALRITLLSRS
jgi:hypothetical protein